VPPVDAGVDQDVALERAPEVIDAVLDLAFDVLHGVVDDTVVVESIEVPVRAWVQVQTVAPRVTWRSSVVRC